MKSPNLKIKLQYRSRKCIHCGNKIVYKKRRVMKTINISNVMECFNGFHRYLPPGDKLARNQLTEYTVISGHINSCKICHNIFNESKSKWVPRYPSYKRVSGGDKISLRTRSYLGKDRRSYLIGAEGGRKFISPILKKV